MEKISIIRRKRRMKETLILIFGIFALAFAISFVEAYPLTYDFVKNNIMMSYDGNNRIINQSGSNDWVIYSYDFEIDETLNNVSNQDVVIDYDYDNRKRISKETKKIDGYVFERIVNYDSMDREDSIKVDETINITYGSNSLMNLISGVLGLFYNEQKQTLNKSYNNFLLTEFDYNNDNFRLIRIGTGAKQNLNYLYDNYGNVKEINDTANSRNVSMNYDDLHRLTYADIKGQERNEFNYTYNSIGNLLQIISTNVNLSYQYDLLAHAPTFINITESNPPTTPTILMCDEQFCINNGTFFGNIEINCSGSVDPEGDAITYSLEAFYSGDSVLELDHFNNSMTGENLSFFGNENITRYLEISKDANVTGSGLNLSSSSQLENVFNGIVAYYNFEQNGLTLEDISGNGHNGIAVGGVTAGKQGIIGNSWAFLDSGWVNITAIPWHVVSDRNFSFSTWVNVTDQNGTTGTLAGEGQKIAGVNTPFFRSYVGTSENPGSDQQGFTGGTINNGTGMTTGIFQHIVVTGDTQFVRIYVNGTEVNKIAFSGTINTNASSLGAYSAGGEGASFLDGDLDEVAIYNRTLSASEVLELYNNGSAKPFEGTITNPYLDVGQDGTREWQYFGEFNQQDNRTQDLSVAINSALNGGTCNCTGCNLNGNNCSIPFLFHSDTAGILEYSDIRVNYISSSSIWENIGNHSETSIFNWDISEIEPQSEVDLRCRAIDIEESNTYSSYFNPSINLTIGSAPLQITELSVVHQNNFERVFKFLIKNFDNSANSISWSLDTGQINQSSQNNATLQTNENLAVFVFHNFTASGNYNVTVRAQGPGISAIRSIQIEI